MQGQCFTIEINTPQKQREKGGKHLEQTGIDWETDSYDGFQIIGASQKGEKLVPEPNAYEFQPIPNDADDEPLPHVLGR